MSRPRPTDGPDGHPLPGTAWKRRFRRRLTGWYARHARQLPWRATRDPYRIWVSEIMLQQTQVATVQPYYQRFISAFPDIQSLAAATEQRVLSLWEGLGYYRRARQLHGAAQQLVSEYGGQFPHSADALQTLPGIGRYTAGAILSIAFDARQPILEANTLRVFSRLLAYRGQATRAAGQKLLWTFGAQILPRHDVGAFNQALMELGSQVCTPRPQCPICPVADLCGARAAGWQHEIPLIRRRTPYEEVQEAAVIVRRRGCVLLRCCGANERWAGLWDFPRFRATGGSPEHEIIDNVKRLTGVEVVPGQRLTTIKHAVTRFRITLTCHLAEYASGRLHGRQSLRWMRHTELENLPLSATGRRIANLLHSAYPS